MARVTSMEALDKKIEKAQAVVSRRKKLYDEAIAELSDLLDKRDALQRDELVKAAGRMRKCWRSWALAQRRMSDDENSGQTERDH